MNRRAPLPGAAELFRRTSNPEYPRTTQSAQPAHAADHAEPVQPAAERGTAKPRARRGSPRQKHDAKITVYVSGAELLALEQARLTLRAEHSLAVDRGRLVREAVAVLLADFEENGADSVLVRRLNRADNDAGAEDSRDAGSDRWGGDGGK